MSKTIVPRDWFGLSDGGQFVLFFVCAFILMEYMLPTFWTGNEINYFDLAYREVRPELFGPDHAIFDASKARFLSFWVIGSVIDSFGFETAKTIFGFLNIVLLALSLTCVAVALALGPLAMSIALAVYINHQSLLGGEWIFGGIEAKVFAYVFVFLGLAAAISNRWLTAVILTAIGTAFHFLVGGFWGVALLGLHLLSTRDWRATLRLLLLFSALVAPIVVLLVTERIDLQINTSGLDLSLAEIYAEFRNPHHLAPFSKGMKTFANSWFPGVTMHAALALAFYLMRRNVDRLSGLTLWVAGLNVYVLLAMIVAFFDRNSHILAALYLFRPAALILFLSILLFVKHMVLRIKPYMRRMLSIPTAIIVAAFVLPDIASNGARFADTFPTLDQRLYAAIDEPQKGVVDWLRTNAKPNDLVLVEPPRGYGDLSEERPFPAGLERLTPAAFYVNFKFVPTAPADGVEWYRRLKKRKAIFDGSCADLLDLAPDYLVLGVTNDGYSLERCTELIFSNREYMIWEPKSE